MKIVMIFFISIMFSNNTMINSYCFEERILEIGQTIKYPIKAMENSLESEFGFNIIEGQVILDTTRNASLIWIFESSINNIKWEIIQEKCEKKDLPKSFTIEFKLGKVDTIFYKNERLTVQKRSLFFITNPEKEEAYFYTNSKLRLKKDRAWSPSFTYKKGRKTVFKYLYTSEESPYIDDDEIIQAIYFQIPNGLQEFSFEDSELLKIGLYYESICEGPCYRRNITKGLVCGKLVNGKWLINLSIKEFQFEKEFELIDKHNSTD